MKHLVKAGAIIALSSLLLISCTKNIAPGDYDSSEVGKIKKVVPGVILSKRSFNIHNQAAESTATDTNSTANDNVVNRSHGFEYVIRLSNGAIISLVQTENLDLKTKQHVLVIYGNNTRVVPDEGSDEF